MLLAIDVGNTNIVFSVLDNNGHQVANWRCVTKVERTVDEFGVWISQLMQLKSIELNHIKDVIISSVVPDKDDVLKNLAQIYFQKEPYFVGSENCPLNIDILVDHPEEVGADRLVNTVAAFHKYNRPMIVIDFGTATTFEVISEKGGYIGGCIAPGIHLSMDALYMAAAKLPHIKIKPIDKVIATNTVDAMNSGVYWGYVSMIDGLISMFKKELSFDPLVVATGGLAHLFFEKCKEIDEIEENLTIYGLWQIYKHLN